MFLQTASRIAFRDLRSAPAKFIAVVLSVAIGVAALSGVKGFGLAFRGMLLRNAKQLIAADLQAPNFGSRREPGADLHRKQGLAQQYGVDWDTLARVPAIAVSCRARR